ncbi:Glycogen synthase [Dirofilaria immitis]
MNKITFLIAFAIIDACDAFYMIARPGGLFKLRNNMHPNLRLYSDRSKKALLLNDPTYLGNLYNHDYGNIPILSSMIDYSIDDRNEQGMVKISDATNSINNNGKYDRKMFVAR